MMKRLRCISATVALVTGVLSVGAALAQTPPLGVTIDPTTGIRGTTVNGQVNPADIAANCVTTVEAFQARFQTLFDGPFVGGNTFGELPETFFPDPNNTVYENTDQMAYIFTLLTVLGISADINGTAAGALPQTFVLTFADFTQQPLGVRGNFDPVTGVGSVTVPDINPGVWPVAATCVGPVLDLEVLKAGIRAGGDFFDGIGLQFGPDGPSSPEFEAFAQGYLGSVNTGFDLLIEFATAVGPDLLVSIVTPDALGVQLFTITTPPLGFTIDPTSGIRGTTVNGQVNPSDIAAYCNTTVESLQAAFGPMATAMQEDEALCEMFFPGAFEPVSGFCQLPDPTNYEQLAYFYLAFAALGINFNLADAAVTALPQTFVMTFADFDQTPLGERGNFDPVTGVGSVVVPDITPGVWPVAATCVAPNLDLIAGAVQQGAQVLEDAGVPPVGTDPDFDYLASIFELAPQVLVPVMAPRALGVQLFTITTPTLGFTIDPTAGLPGDTVNGQVDPEDIAAHCVTDLAAFQAQFQALLEGPYAGGGTSGELFDRFFPTPEFIFTTTDQTAYSITGIISLGIGANIGGAAESALPQTFVMTFADLLTQAPLGPLGHFDPVTGVGSVVVPNIDPGVYPIAATCVRPTFDLDLLEAGIRRNGAYLTSIGMPADINSPEFEEFIQNYPGANGDLFTFLNLIGPAMIQNIVTPGALGVQFYNVLADVDHFQCYRARTTGFTGGPVTLSDRFGNRSATVRSAIDLCAPANKNGEDPEAAGSPDFLTSYKISTSGSFQQVTGVPAVNQFGPVSLNVKKPKVLLVPSAVSPTAPPSSPDGAFLNHFTCYDVRVTNGTPAPLPGTVTVQTTFETVQVQPQKPKRLCVPTSKNSEPVIGSRPENLLCYKAKSKGGLNPAPTVFLANQFGSQTQRLGQRREICIPTELTP